MPRTVYDSFHQPPPRYVVDLSLPPKERYKRIAAQYRAQLRDLTTLFDELLLDLALPPSWLPTVTRVSRLLMRKLYDSEQTQELRGIHEETGIAMYLLVALNVVLDLLMGCTSGAVRVADPEDPSLPTRMLHFRTLDWTMDPLRRVVVQLDFVRSKSSTPEKILASSITYVGFVGVLTGVRDGLSVSLNFRPLHNAKSRSDHFRFYFHHLLVLLGRRPSIASLLRKYLIGEPASSIGNLLDPAGVASDLQNRHTTAAYITLSDGENTVTMEKDFSDARIRESPTFIAITNHDKEEGVVATESRTANTTSKGAELRQSTVRNDIIEDSEDRLHCIQRKWEAKQRRSQRPSRRNTRSRAATNSSANNSFPSRKELIQWLCDWPTTNECTHYAAILDATAGEVTWSRLYLDPLCEPNPNI